MRRLFILRPEPGASESGKRARGLGLDPVIVPLFEIMPVDWTAPNPAEFDALLLTSANAVRNAGAQLERVQRLPVHAVGEATAKAARAAGLRVTARGEGGVDALLASIPVESRLLHLCGEDRREPQAPRQQIVAIPVYRSRPRSPDGALSDIAGSVAAVHSPRAAARLAGLVPAAERASVRIAAISTAAAEAAGDGWACVAIAAAPEDGAVLALAASLCEKDGQK